MIKLKAKIWRKKKQLPKKKHKKKHMYLIATKVINFNKSIYENDNNNFPQY